MNAFVLCYNDKLNADESLPAHCNIQYAAVSEKIVSLMLTHGRVAVQFQYSRVCSTAWRKKEHDVGESNREWSARASRARALIEDRWAKCFQTRADSLILLAARVAAKKWGSSFTNGQQSLADATAQTAHSSSVRLLPPRPTYIAGPLLSLLVRHRGGPPLGIVT